MIDPTLFSLDHLLSTMLDERRVGAWLQDVTIVPAYRAPNAPPDARTYCAVVWRVEDRRALLRYSAGPRQGYFWDLYGEDFMTPELALLAVLAAPAPPGALR